MLNSLQACRALAAILIVLAHANFSIFGLAKYYGYRPLGDFLDFAPAAVDVFLVLSGFLITYAHAADIDQPRALARYFWKRYSRVYLFYWVLLAVLIPIYFLAPQFGIGHERDPRVIVGSVLLLPHPQNHFILGVAWTLPFEMLFYAVFGLLVINKRLGIAVFACWTAGLLAHLAYPWVETFPWNFVYNNMHLRIIAGVCVCLFFQTYRIPQPRLTAALGVGLFLTMGMVEVFHGLGTLTYVVGYTLSSVMMIGGFAEADRSGLIQPPNWLVQIGNATYSIYLVHFVALSLVAKLSKAAQLDQWVPLTLLFFFHVVLAIGIGCLCHRWIEMPLYHWSKRFFRDTRPAGTVTFEVEVRKAA